MRRADKEFQKWFESRPPQIQKAIRQFPIGTTFHHAGELLHLLGWSEVKDSDEVTLIFSIVDPFKDYDAAQEQDNRRYICAHHLQPMAN